MADETGWSNCELSPGRRQPLPGQPGTDATHWLLERQKTRKESRKKGEKRSSREGKTLEILAATEYESLRNLRPSTLKRGSKAKKRAIPTDLNISRYQEDWLRIEYAPVSDIKRLGEVKNNYGARQEHYPLEDRNKEYRILILAALWVRLAKLWKALEGIRSKWKDEESINFLAAGKEWKFWKAAHRTNRMICFPGQL